MKAEIVTEYCGENEYRVVVMVDGAVVEILPAMTWTVTRVRTRLCHKWSRVADHVEATEIPRAWDMADERISRRRS